MSTSYGTINLLYFPSSRPTDKKIFCIHGYCCDARIFAYMGRELAKKGFDVYSVDLFGHGQSDGPKGDLDFDKTISALHEVISNLRGESRVFLMGHSLGCTYLLWYLRTYEEEVDGVVLMAMYVRIKNIKYAGDALPGIGKFFWFYILRHITPNRRVSATKVVRSSVLATKEVQQMIADPQINYHYSYRYIIDTLVKKNMDAQTLANVNVPVLLVHGRNDKNVIPQVSEEFFKLLKSNQKSIQLFDCNHWFYHAIFYTQNGEHVDSDREQVISAISSWLDGVANLSRKD